MVDADPDPFPAYAEKKARVYKNGDPLAKAMTIKLSGTLRMKDLRRICGDFFGFSKNDKFRVFSGDGVELLEEDLQFLKNGVTLYVSRGEEFDANSTFSEYQIVKELGEGGFGKVLLGVHKKTGEKVAIKILKTNMIGNAQDIDMVFKEAEVLKSLSHQNIVHIQQCYTLTDMQVVFIMEFLEGGELLDRLEKKGRFTEDEARDYFRQLTDAMAYCHKNKLIHRDLKLENLLLVDNNSNTIRVCDFGIAGGSSNLSVDNIDAGSLCYMAPEVLQGKLKKLEPSIDVWAMGVILYCMLSGTLPFKGATAEELKQEIIAGKIEIPQDVMKKLSPECIDVFHKTLVLDHTQRISTQELMYHPWIKDRKFDHLMKLGQVEEEKEEVKQESLTAPKAAAPANNKPLAGRRGSVEKATSQQAGASGRAGGAAGAPGQSAARAQKPSVGTKPGQTMSKAVSTSKMAPQKPAVKAGGAQQQQQQQQQPQQQQQQQAAPSGAASQGTRAAKPNVTELAQKYGPNQNKNLIYGTSKR